MSDTETTYTIDELAARTQVPSRTIRFYQAQKILDRPVRKGRQAFYTDAHVTRLELIAQLQDRGLRIRGIKELLTGPDREAAVAEWLGLSDRLSTPFTEEKARVVDEAEMAALIGDRPAGTLAAVRRAGLAQRREDAPSSFLVPSPGLLEVALNLLDAGLDLDTQAQIEPVIRDGLRESAELVVDQFLDTRRLAEPGGEERLRATFDTLRHHGARAVSILFAQEVERALQALLEQGPPSRRKPRKRRKPTRRR